MKNLFVLLLVSAAALAQGHLLVTEVCVTPTDGEFVEIYNPTSSSVSLTNYYLCDLYGTSSTVTSFYPQLVAGAITTNSNDFCVKFPAGASIAAGEVITVAVSGTGFQTTYGSAPDYELMNTGVGTMMIIPTNGFIGSVPGLTNGDEVVVLFYWNSTSDLVQDVDYALWGDDTTRRVDKSTIALDGPDGDTSPSVYYTDTASSAQSSISLVAHAAGNSFQRLAASEGSEVTSGGNGITGHNETSEDMDDTWLEAAATPGMLYTSLTRSTWGDIKSLYGL